MWCTESWKCEDSCIWFENQLDILYSSCTDMALFDKLEIGHIFLNVLVAIFYAADRLGPFLLVFATLKNNVTG